MVSYSRAFARACVLLSFAFRNWRGKACAPRCAVRSQRCFAVPARSAPDHGGESPTLSLMQHPFLRTAGGHTPGKIKAKCAVCCGRVMFACAEGGSGAAGARYVPAFLCFTILSSFAWHCAARKVWAFLFRKAKMTAISLVLRARCTQAAGPPRRCSLCARQCNRTHTLRRCVAALWRWHAHSNASPIVSTRRNSERRRAVQ